MAHLRLSGAAAVPRRAARRGRGKSGCPAYIVAGRPTWRGPGADGEGCVHMRAVAVGVAPSEPNVSRSSVS